MTLRRKIRAVPPSIRETVRQVLLDYTRGTPPAPVPVPVQPKVNR